MEAQNDSLMMPLSGPKNGALEAMKAGVDKSIWPMRIGMEKAAHKVRKASDRFGHTLDFSSEEGQRLPIQSLQNINAREQFGAVFAQPKWLSRRGYSAIVKRLIGQSIAQRKMTFKIDRPSEVRILVKCEGNVIAFTPRLRHNDNVMLEAFQAD